MIHITSLMDPIGMSSHLGKLLTVGLRSSTNHAHYPKSTMAPPRSGGTVSNLVNDINRLLKVGFSGVFKSGSKLGLPFLSQSFGTIISFQILGSRLVL